MKIVNMTILTLMTVLLMPPLVTAQEAYEQVVLPSSRELVGALADAAGAEKLGSQVGDANTATYGFSTDVTEERGSFQLGVLLADLEASVNGNEKQKTLDAIVALAEGLIYLGANADMVMAVMNMRVAVYNGVDLDSINQASLPVIRPFIESFIEAEGNMLYLRLGEWVESLHLVASVGESGGEGVAHLLRVAGVAEDFAAQLEAEGGAPQGVFKHLETLATVGAKESPTGRDFAATQQATDGLKALIG